MDKYLHRFFYCFGKLIGTNVQHFNFSAGPAMLPAEVMQQAHAEMLNWQGLGSSVMEISHRSKPFIEVAAQAEQDLRDLLFVPNNYKVLFLQGGGRGQFTSVPLNIAQPNDLSLHLQSGSWSKGAVSEAAKYTRTHVVAQDTVNTEGLRVVPAQHEWSLTDEQRTQAAYLHYCPNETVDGIAIFTPPKLEDVPLVADMSSTILSGPLNVNDFGIIYASAQKNIGPSGLAVVIVRDDLLDKAQSITPSFLNYTIQANSDSMYNTPPTYSWYLSGLVFKWLKAQGGLSVISKRNETKAALLYDAIDNNDFYHNNVAKQHRSIMNVPFTLANSALDSEFLSLAEANGLAALKGHRSVGGMRASIYNAMTLEGVQALVDFMHEFSRTKG